MVRQSQALKHFAKWFEDNLNKAKEDNTLITGVQKVGKEAAAFILQRNPNNRNIRNAKLNQYMTDMIEDRWEMNGEPIVIAMTGELNDGQHRLEAIVRTNTEHNMFFVFGPTRDSRYTIDTGAARSAGDHLGLSGVANSNQLAAIARRVIAWERADKENLGRPNEVSSTAVIERVAEDGLLVEATHWIAGHGSKMKHVVNLSVLGFCFYAFSTANPKTAKCFMESFRDGIGLTKASAIRVVREKLMMSPRLSFNQKIELMFRAWNHWCKDSEVSTIPVMGRLPKLES